MPIVLAIEPDRRQAAHLTAIVRHQVGAELILADTTEGALDAIGDRVPDLVLVPALLSPSDDAALAAALRVIAVAAHVRTLTIPALAHAAKRATEGGILAKWRRSRATSPEPDGCEPAVFGEQISAYLLEAAAEQAELEDDPLETVAIPVIAPIATASVTIEPIVAGPVVAGPVVAKPIVAKPIVVEPVFVESMFVEPTAAVAEVPPEESVHTTVEPWAADAIDLSDELDGLSDEIGDEEFDGERVGIYTLSAEIDEPQAEVFDLLAAIAEPDAIAPQPIAPVVELRAEGPAQPDALFFEPPEPPRADIEPWVPMYLSPGRIWPALEGMPAETPAARAEQPDWIELVASLRQDLERRRTDLPSTADPIAARPSDGAESKIRPFVKKARPHAKAKPIQDEWGFFDPEQCGFSTLLAKLEEITEEEVRR